MKVKTSITLSREVVKAIGRITGAHSSRSEFIEEAIRAYIAMNIREQRNVRDLEILNTRAGRLNREAAAVLDYQAIL
jgi:metal-responsive CopG/Arc/MetJ family transcriptional regulator